MVLAAIPLTSFAGEVDRKTAADPVAVLAQIEAMNLPEMPVELADQLRGEGLENIPGILYWSWAVYGVPLSINLAAYVSRWKPGTLTALGYVLHDLGLCRRCPGR